MSQKDHTFQRCDTCRQLYWREGVLKNVHCPVCNFNCKSINSARESGPRQHCVELVTFEQKVKNMNERMNIESLVLELKIIRRRMLEFEKLLRDDIELERLVREDIERQKKRLQLLNHEHKILSQQRARCEEEKKNLEEKRDDAEFELSLLYVEEEMYGLCN